jgi:uncharacterized protein (DUF697 family)
MTTNEEENAILRKISEFLEDAFDSVALTRRQHFEENPRTRPSPADVQRIITSYANQNALIAGAANLIPGPFGALAVLPEVTLVVRNQIQMIYDLGVAFGHQAHLTGNTLVVMFSTVSGGGAVGLATVKGGKLLLRRASLRVIQKIIEWLGGQITQRVLRALLAKWVPVVGAGAMALWARHTTRKLGERAIELLKHQIDETPPSDADTDQSQRSGCAEDR